MKYFLMFFSIIVLRCCWGSTDYQLIQIQQNDDTILKVLDGTYEINILNGEDVSSNKLTIIFNDSTKQVSGFSGCNRFFGSYTLNNFSLKFSALGATKMLCQEDANKIETNLFKAIGKANLVLFTKNGFSFYNKKKLILSASEEMSYDSLKIEYSTTSMNAYRQIILSKETVSKLQKRGSKPTTKVCQKEDWDKITKAIKPIDMNTISLLEAPSKAFLFDGAAMAHLKISYKDSIYESPPFDHGNPPKDIEKLVKEILSISEIIE
ncbi:MAG: META domain-containing protein [Flavobacteriaceae bacterium]